MILERGKNVIEHEVMFDKKYLILCFVLLLIEHNCALAIRRGNIARAHATLPSLIAVCALVVRQDLDGSFAKNNVGNSHHMSRSLRHRGPQLQARKNQVPHVNTYWWYGQHRSAPATVCWASLAPTH